MADRQYTIIIVPRTKADLRKFHVSSRFISYAFISLAALLLLSIGTAIHYVKLYRQTRVLEKVQMENAQLRANLNESQVLTQKLTRKISFLAGFSSRLRAMAGLPTGVRKHSSNPGMGGVSIEGTRNVDPQKLLDLQKKADNLEESLTWLHQYFHDRNSQPSIMPAEGYISSPFGARRNPFTNLPDFHEGIDITNDIGTPVLAPADGVVISTGYRGSFGQVIEIRHEGDVTTLFGHLAQIRVRPGQKVSLGEQIGLMGNSGKSTGPHLHYEIHVHDQPVNPRAYLESIAG